MGGGYIIAIHIQFIRFLVYLMLIAMECIPSSFKSYIKHIEKENMKSCLLYLLEMLRVEKNIGEKWCIYCLILMENGTNVLRNSIGLPRRGKLGSFIVCGGFSRFQTRFG